MTLSLRLATEDDIPALCALDHIAAQDESRCQFIARSVNLGQCHVALWDEHIVGYGVLDYSFFEQGFVSLLYVHSDFRRNGTGRALMNYLQTHCSTNKLFTATNLSNLPMQALLGRLGFSLSGVIHNLDEGDPELVYFKRVGVSNKVD